MEIALLYVTTRDHAEAGHLARTLLGERLIACGNILNGMVSIYRWQDQVNEETETVLLLKTRSDLVDRVTERIRQLHSYECPCVVAWKSSEGNPEYFQWVQDETAADSAAG